MNLNEQVEEAAPNANLDEIPLTSSSEIRYHSFKTVLCFIATISLSSFYFGYTIIYLSVIEFTAVMKIFDIEMEQAQAEGILTFCVQLGGLFGSGISGFFIHRVSRMNSIIMVSYAAIALGILSFFAGYELYMLVRIGQGVCAGIFSAMVPLLIKETAPFELLGVFGVFHQLFITIGIFIACLFSFLLSVIYSDPTGFHYWPWVFALPLAVLALQLFLLYTFFDFEPPKYLVAQKQETQAKQALKRIYKDDFIKEVYSSYLSDCQDEQREAKVRKQKNQKQPWLPKAVAIHLSLLQQFVGISAVAIYAGDIASGQLQNVKAFLPTLLNFEQVVTAVVSSFLLTKFGRKTILQWGTIGCVITTGLIGLGFAVDSLAHTLSVGLILVGLFCYMANFGLTLGPIVWMYIPEVVHPSFLPYSTMVNWGGAAVSILFFPIIKEHLPGQNPSGLFFFFTAWSAVSFFVNQKFVIETMGKTERQIKEQYYGLQGQTSAENKNQQMIYK